MKIWRDYSGKIYESGDTDGGSDFNRYESTHGDYNPDEDDELWEEK